MNFYIVVAISQSFMRTGYRMMFVSAANEHEAIGLGIESISKREPNATVSECTATLLSREKFEEVGIDPVEYFSKEENE